MNVSELREYFLRVLNPENKNFGDDFANDLQINCYNENIKKVGFGVSPSIEFFKRAKESGCDVVVCHHSLSLNNRGIDKSIPNKILNDRMKFLYENGISLFGFHYLLDNHFELGNNADIIRRIGCLNFDKFGVENDDNWGWSGEFDFEQDLDEVVEKLDEFYLGNSQVFKFGSEKIKRVAIVSGGGSDCLTEADRENIDLFITGNISESTQEIARELGINVLWGGHYITERVGVINLMEKVKKDLNLDCEFVEVMNKN